jgi:hypothetical protein
VVFPLVSLTAMDMAVPFVFVVGSVTVKVPLPLAGETDACDGEELTAVNVDTPDSLAVNAWE